MQEEDRPRVAGAQIERTCAWNYVCYRSGTKMRTATCQPRYARADSRVMGKGVCSSYRGA